MNDARISHLSGTTLVSPPREPIDLQKAREHLRAVIVQEYIDKLPTQLTVPGTAYLLGLTVLEVEALIEKHAIIARGSGYARYIRPSDNRTFLLDRTVLRMPITPSEPERFHHIDVGIDLEEALYERLYDFAVTSDLSLPAAVSTLLAGSLTRV